MSDVANLDVLVVYSSSVALSASVTDTDSKFPFLMKSKQAGYNLSYAYFLDSCRKQGMSAGFTTSADIIGPGKCQGYWTNTSGSWNKNSQRATSKHIFDKLSPRSSTRAAERELLLSDQQIAPFNDVELHALFFDKLQTYQKLHDFCIPTVAIQSGKPQHIRLAIRQLRLLTAKSVNTANFSSKMVLKDRYGAGGNHVYQIHNQYSEKISAIMQKNKSVHFILQPFFDSGTTSKNKQAQTAADVRLIYQHDRLLQCYVRTAKLNDFRCNQHQGGTLVYIDLNDVPQNVLTTARKVIKKINKPHSLYALDFLVSTTGKIYLIEGNANPGINWTGEDQTDEKMSKQLIRGIVSEFATRIHGA